MVDNVKALLPGFTVMLSALCVLVMTACGSTSSAPQSGAASSTVPTPEQVIQDLQIVDCLLPGQMRFLGNRSYLTPRRPARTTAAECRILGGEYVAFDRADYKTALAVWMPAAEAGDVEAQVSVGEIYEKGLGGTPNYEAAVIWYQKAAEQGNRRAQFNLGTLYEQGLGVEKNMIAALNYYRESWGLPQDDIIFTSAVSKEAAQQEEKYKAEIARAQRRIDLLEKQKAELAQNLTANKDELSELNAMIDEMDKEKQVNIAQLDEVIRLRQPTTTNSTTPVVSDNTPVNVKGKNFGRYFALIIGNQDYQNMNDLVTPLKDIEKIGQILRDQYNFEVTLIKNSSNVTMMEQINNLNEVLTEEDNLLIYYAGHGSRLENDSAKTTAGFWLPVNAEAPPRDTFWVSNEFVTRHLGRIKAKRVLVIADSCFAGLLANSPGYALLSDSASAPTEKYVDYKLPRRARLLLTSGADQPVLDSGGGDYSVFAKAFIDVLENNHELMTAPQLFSQVKVSVVDMAKKLSFEQQPEYSVIKEAGHEVGDFFFVPR
jgi:uncharacterized protein